MHPLVTDTAGLDPLVLALFGALTSVVGFVARQWIKDRDYERAQCTKTIDGLQAKLDAYESRAFKLAAIVNDPHDVPHTGDQARASGIQPTRTRERPRGPGND